MSPAQRPRGAAVALQQSPVPSPASPSLLQQMTYPFLRLFALLRAPLGPRSRWAALSWPHQAAGGVGVSGRRARTLKTLAGGTGAAVFLMLLFLYLRLLEFTSRLYLRSHGCVPMPSPLPLQLAPKLSWPIPVRCLDG